MQLNKLDKVANMGKLKMESLDNLGIKVGFADVPVPHLMENLGDRHSGQRSGV
jgi:hypothetical protein